MATTASMTSCKALKVALSAAMVSTMAVGISYLDVQDAFAAGADTSWYDAGSDTYSLKDASDLAGLAQLVNNGTDFAGKTVQFKASTTLKLDSSYTPIGTQKHAFNGTFEGNNLKVTGLAISGMTSYAGLFGNCGSSSLIKDVSVTGTITALATSGSKTIIHHIGGVVGNSAGSLDNCDSSVKITLSSAAKSTESDNAVIHHVGAVAGQVTGDVTGCDTTKTASVSVTSTSAPASDDVTWVAGWVGGIVGEQGPSTDDLEALANPSSIISCTNKAKVTMVSSASGKPDRFGNPTAASTRFLGGIAGAASGNISNCSNTADIDSAYRNKKGKAALSYGCVACGGIVGGYRIDTKVNTAGDTDDPGLRYQKKYGTSADISITDCTNSALVFGLGQAGGIVGQAGSYTLVTRCSNSGQVKGSRYTKPSPGGIAGRTYGNISYCYNTGDVETTTGGGYYAAGIVGMLHSIGKDGNDETIVPEVWACYNTGYILTNGGSYRSGSVVGEMDGGYIHDTYSLKNRVATNSVSGLSDYTGTMVNVREVEEKEISSASLIARLNACCDKEGWSNYYTLPSGAAYGDKCVPVLVSASNEGAVDLTGKTATLSSNNKASYSASIDPVPAVSVTYNGTKLVQNADYRVVGQEGTKGANAGSTAYEASIVGIGNYTGTLASKASYTIGKASIKSCTLTAASMYYNYEPQKPKDVVLYDEGGNVVDASQYSWDVDQSKFGVKSGSRVQYQDAVDKNAAEGDPIIVTASDNGNYTGSATFNVFKIKPVALVNGKSGESDNPNQDSLVFGDVTYEGPDGTTQTWKFSDVCSAGTNNAIGNSDLRGTLKVKYTGQPIKLGLTGITYMGKELKEIKAGDAWYNNTKSWGYKLLYGNSNPEDAATAADDLSLVTNATQGKTDSDGNPVYAVMTIRSAPYSNFDNYVTLWFTITQASLEDDVTISGFEDEVSYISGKQEAAKLTYNGMTLVEGTDYTASYSYDGSQATVTYAGMGNYTGTVTKSFAFTGKIVSAPKNLKAKSAKKGKMTLKWGKLAGIDGYQVRYKVANGSWKTAKVAGAKKTSVTLKVKSKKKCKMQVRAYKKSGKITSYTPWSKTVSKKAK